MTKRKTSCFTIHLLIIFLLIGILILFCSNKKNILESFGLNNDDGGEDDEFFEECSENICEDKKDNWEKNNSNYSYSCEKLKAECKVKKMQKWKECKRKCIKKNIAENLMTWLKKKAVVHLGAALSDL